MLLSMLQVALGGAIGSVLRFVSVQVVGAPLATLVVNILGSFAIGAIFVLMDGRAGWQLFLMTGVLGGFTTFSAFSLDTLKLVQSGQHLTAIAYVMGTVALSLIAVALGVALAKGIQ